MAIRGIGIEGVASEIGALTRMKEHVSRERLTLSLMRRFQAEEYQARLAIDEAIKVNAVAVDENGLLYIVGE